MSRSRSYRWWNVAGIALYMLSGGLANQPNSPDQWIISGLLILGVGCLVYGLSRMAVYKGHHFAWGLMGLAGVLGLLLVFLLPNRRSWMV